MDAKLTILIVDDDALDRMAVSRALHSSNLPCVIREAESGAEALVDLGAELFDCVFLDYRLPDADGLSVLRAARAAGFDVPIIMLTGQGDEELAVELMKAGATDYLPKGRLTPQQLVGSLIQALRAHHAELERRRTEDRLRFLAEMSRLLVTSLDYHANLRSLADLMVPQLADLCLIDVVELDGSLLRLAVAAAREVPAAIQAAMRGSSALDPAAAIGPAHVIASAHAEQHPFMSAELLASLAPEATADLSPDDFGGLLSVPLMVRGRPLGALTFVRLAASRRYDPDDLAFIEEVARRAALAVDNALLYHEAQEAIRMRDAFLSVAAHELNTPLTSLLGYAEMIHKRIERSPTANEREQRMARVVVDQARRLRRMIATLLDLSRLQVGQISVERSPIDLCLLTRRIVEETRPSLSQHTIRLSCDPEPITIMGDELRLEQTLQNLIQNAVKYSPQGGEITVIIQQQGDWAVLRVRDTGIGIPREALQRIFWRFYRAANTSKSSASGMGIGLYVVKQIVELHEGRVEVESSEGAGSTFSIWLPLVGAPVAV